MLAQADFNDPGISYIANFARHEEAMPLLVLAHFSKCFQIEEFPNRASLKVEIRMLVWAPIPDNQ